MLCIVAVVLSKRLRGLLMLLWKVIPRYVDAVARGGGMRESLTMLCCGDNAAVSEIMMPCCAMSVHYCLLLML